MKRLLRLCLLASLVLAASLCAATAQGARAWGIGLYDDNQSLYGNTDRAFATLGALRTQMLRVNLSGAVGWAALLRVPWRRSSPSRRRPTARNS